VERLPLFPLGTVLTPGAQMPLRVFEPRYVALVQDLLRSEQPARFGVVAIRRGIEVGAEAARELHDVGCVASVSALADTGEGQFLLAVQGTRRFRLDALLEDCDKPYLVAGVTMLGEPDGATPEELARSADLVRRALTDHARSLGELRAGWPTSPVELSHAVGTALGLELAERQELLAAPDTAKRLGLGLAAARRERRLASTLHVVATAPHLTWNAN
jgi:uncharacterized protein